MATISVSGTERRKQETVTALPTNGMFLRGTKDSNLFQLNASVPEDQGKTQRRDKIGVKFTIVLLLSTGQESHVLTKGHPLLERRHDGRTAA